MGFAESVTQDGSGGDGTTTLSRSSFVVTSSSLVIGAEDSSHLVDVGKTALLFRIVTSRPARVRLYSTVADMVADLARPVNIEVTAGTGVIMEVVTAPGLLAIDLGPMVIASSLTSPTPGPLPIAIQNLDVASGVVVVTYTGLQLES